MIEIRSLENLDHATLYQAFKVAFIDYEMQLEAHELEIMLQRRGFDPMLSFGAFDQYRLIAFTFNGIGIFDRVQTAYDTGTGTIREYRGQGLATRIFKHSIPYLKRAGIKQYLLEVLQHNQGAVNLYRKLGFQVTREFIYFIHPRKNLNLHDKPFEIGYSVKPVEALSLVDKVDFPDFNPSWQNSIESIKRGIGQFKALAVYFQHEVVAYGIYDPDSGDITSLAVSQAHRRHHIGSNLLNAVSRDISADVLKVINIPSDAEGVLAFLAACDIQSTGKQFEMIKKL
jgi:ribosomal protein S18 acetylase RimI-like enzyme